STYQSIDDVLSTLSDDGFQEFVTYIQAQSGCVDVFRFWSNATSHLHQISDEETTQQGGFLLNLEYGIGVHHTGHGSASDLVEGDFEWELSPNDRRLTVASNILSTAPFPPNEGPDTSILDTGLRNMLGTAVSAAIYQQADREQVFYGIPGCAGHPNCFACTQGPTNDSSVTFGDTTTDCFPFVTRVKQLAQDGAALISPPLTTLEFDEVEAKTINAHHANASGVQVYDWVRCNAYSTATSTISRCEYVVPAKRIVAFPDQVELVFLDGGRDLDNPAYPIYLIGLQAPIISRGATNPLCVAGPIPGPSSQRSFANEFRGYVEVPKITSPCF
ncbi:MAG: hypothetical protein ACRELB_08780, partial [Polyangiaceae bacterium]